MDISTLYLRPHDFYMKHQGETFPKEHNLDSLRRSTIQSKVTRLKMLGIMTLTRNTYFEYLDELGLHTLLALTSHPFLIQDLDKAPHLSSSFLWPIN